MFLTTKRLIIRDFSEQDLDPLSLILGNEEVMRFSLAGPRSFEQTRDYLQNRILNHYADHGFGLWALIEREENRLIGLAGFLQQEIDGELFVELGYRLDPTYWGKGFAQEAASSIVEYGFNELGLEKIISIIDKENKKSLKVAARIGMHYWKSTTFHGIAVQIYALNKVIVSSFKTSWQSLFENEKEQLTQVFKNFPIDFFHIGSTAIENCSAKPVIDILGVTPDILEIDPFNEKMEALGFIPLGENGMNQRRFFQRKHSTPVHLHIFEESDPEVDRHLRFCHYLRSHPDKIQEYSSLKESLAKQFPHDIQSYILGKRKWIKEIDILAAQNTPVKLKKEKWHQKRKTWTEQEIKSAMQVNMHLHMTYFAKYIPTMEIVPEPDVTVVVSKLQDDTFNYVLAAQFQDSNVRDRVRHIKSLFQTLDLPFSWWISETDTPSHLEDALLNEGFCFKEKNIGMFLNLAEFTPSPPTSSLLFQRVESAAQLKDFAAVIEAIGGSPLAFEVIYSHLPPSIYAGKTSVELHLAYFEGKPSITGLLVTHANVAGIYYVATVPDLRKRGFGTAMMNYLLERAQNKGYFLATLQASEQGYKLYEQLGFKTCCEFKEAKPSS